MKKIIVKKENSEKIMKIFSEVQGRATARTIDSYSELEKIIEGIEKRVHLGFEMKKKSLEGTRVHYSFKQHFPKSYKYSPSATLFDLEYSKGKWYLCEVERGSCPESNSYYKYDLFLSDTAKMEVLSWYR